MNITEEMKKAYTEACKAREAAYAPYSQFKVGACFKQSGKNSYFSGFNIENSSYPASMCAERVALYSMSAKLLIPPHPEFLVIVTDTDYALGPCGQCLQVMTEFCDPTMPVHTANLQGIQKTTLLKDFIQFDTRSFQKTLRDKP